MIIYNRCLGVLLKWNGWHRLGRVLIPLLWMAFFSTCDVISPPPPEGLKEKPKGRIVEGPAENETLTKNSITIRWTGNTPQCEFRYRLANYEYYPEWSEWSQKDTTRLFDLLDDTTYVFELQTKYKDAIEIKDTTVLTRPFKTKAADGPTIKLLKLKTAVMFNTNFIVAVRMQNVDNYFSGGFNLKFDKTKLTLVAVLDGGLATSKGYTSVLLPDYGITSVKNAANQNGIIELTTGILVPNGSASQTISGSGNLCLIQFRAIGLGESLLEFSDVQLSNASNQEITLIPPVNGKVIIK